MKTITILFTFISLSAFSQTDTTKIELDTFVLTTAHQQMLPQLLQEKAEIERQLRENERNLEILLSAYVDRKRIQAGQIQAIDQFRKIIVKK